MQQPTATPSPRRNFPSAGIKKPVTIHPVVSKPPNSFPSVPVSVIPSNPPDETQKCCLEDNNYCVVHAIKSPVSNLNAKVNESETVKAVENLENILTTMTSSKHSRLTLIVTRVLIHRRSIFDTSRVLTQIGKNSTNITTD